MRKVFPFVLSGLLAVSFSQFAAAQSTSVQGGANANVGADVNKSRSGDTGVKSTDSAATSASGGSSTGASTGPGGVSADKPHADNGKHKGASKNRKSKNKDMDKQSSTTKSDKDTTAAGSTTSGRTSSNAAAGGSARSDTSAAPSKSDNSVKSGAQSPMKSEKRD